MISTVSFKDFRMFKGQQNIQLSPLTIFTGPNNSGKSTIIKLIKKVVDNSNNLWLQNPDLMKFIDDYSTSTSKPSKGRNYSKEIGINNVSFKYLQNSRFISSVHFYENGISLATIDPLGVNHPLGDGDETETWSCIKIHLDNIYRVESHWYSGYFKKESEEFKRNLRIILESEWPDDLFKTSLNNYPLFKTEDGDNYTLQIILHNNNSEYKSFLADSYYSYLSCYKRDILDSIMRNPSLSQNYKKAISNVLEYVFRFFILSDLQTIKELHDKNIFYSAYRGSFIMESDSQANRSFQMLNEKWKGVVKKRREKGFKRADLLFHKEEARLLKKWLKMFDIGDDIYLDVEQLNAFRIEVQKDIERYPFELGFGNQQLLPLILGILSNPSSLCFVEEPESHLHPYLQSMLADFFVEATTREDKSNQFIIETHSEYLIRKLQYLVAKKAINSDDIALYYINNTLKAPPNATQIQRLKFNSDGTLNQNFGPGFFDEADNLALELMRLRHIQKN